MTATDALTGILWTSTIALTTWPLVQLVRAEVRVGLTWHDRTVAVMCAALIAYSGSKLIRLLTGVFS